MYKAKKYFDIGNGIVRPGEYVETLTQEQWRTLADMGAIETEPDAVMATIDDGQGLDEYDGLGDEVLDAIKEVPETEEVSETEEAVEEVPKPKDRKRGRS